MTREVAIRELLIHEELRETYHKLDIKLNRQRSPQLSEVWVKEEDNQKTVFDNNTSVERYLLERNESHLQQANMTPFAQGDKSIYLGDHGEGEFTQRVLNGEYLHELESSEEVMKAYLEGLAYGTLDIPESVDVTLELKEYKKFWKKKKEITVTSPYGLHIGHYKAVLEEDDILECHMALMMIPFRFAYAPKRWTSTVQIMLEKNPGTPWSHRLRIIELFDTQLNAAMKIFFGKRMVYNALDRDQIHPSAFGSVPGRSAQDALLEKELGFDMMRLTRTEGAIFDCDAKGCFDRIIAKFASIHTTRLGVPPRWSIFFSIFWKECSHYVRTRYGVSKNSFKAENMKFLHGIGQGNGAGPALWLTHLTVMFEVLSKLTTGYQFKSPDGETNFESPGTGFVDDVTLGATANQHEERESKEASLITKINRIASCWEKMLHTNGGKLELSKCFWILVAWKWRDGMPVMKTLHDTNADINLIQSESGDAVTITRKSVEESPKVLGCHMAANGSWKCEHDRWKRQSAEFANKIKVAGFDRTCGAKLFPVFWLSKYRYVAPIIGLTQEQCKKIERPVISKCMSASGFNCRMPREVVFGSIKYGGMAWESMYSLQTFEKVKIFIRNTRLNTRLGRLLRIVVETAQLLSGIKDSITDTTTEWTRWCTTSWIASLSEGLIKIKGGLETTFTRHRIVREYDRHVMNIFDDWKLSKQDLKNLNACRLFLQVITVADIATQNGNHIEECYKECRHNRESVLTWPVQIEPTNKQKKLWTRMIDRLCIGENLITSLGRWTSPTHQIWEHMVEVPEGRLLIKKMRSNMRIIR